MRRRGHRCSGLDARGPPGGLAAASTSSTTPGWSRRTGDSPATPGSGNATPAGRLRRALSAPARAAGGSVRSSSVARRSEPASKAPSSSRSSPGPTEGGACSSSWDTAPYASTFAWRRSWTKSHQSRSGRRGSPCAGSSWHRTTAPSTRRSTRPSRTSGASSPSLSRAGASVTSSARGSTRRSGSSASPAARSRAARSPASTRTAGSSTGSASGRPGVAAASGFGLLLASFGEFRRRGARRASLGVDAANESGATRLYERAGMRVLFRFDRYEKALR